MKCIVKRAEIRKDEWFNLDYVIIHLADVDDPEQEGIVKIYL